MSPSPFCVQVDSGREDLGAPGAFLDPQGTGPSLCVPPTLCSAFYLYVVILLLLKGRETLAWGLARSRQLVVIHKKRICGNKIHSFFFFFFSISDIFGYVRHRRHPDLLGAGGGGKGYGWRRRETIVMRQGSLKGAREKMIHGTSANLNPELAVGTRKRQSRALGPFLSSPSENLF